MHDGFEYRTGSAQLLARDVADMVTPADLDRLIGILTPEIDPNGPLVMVHQTDAAAPDQAREILVALTNELIAQRAKA